MNTEIRAEPGYSISEQAKHDYDPRSRLELLSAVALSRPHSPRQQLEREQWLSELGKDKAQFDRVIIDEMLQLFQHRVAGWFSCFRNAKICITKRTRREWYLAMSAVGALFCPVAGSSKLAMWLYHCARQRLFSFVSIQRIQVR